MSAGDILGQVVLAIWVYIWVWPLPALRFGGRVPLAEQLDKTAGLILCSSEARGWALQLPGFSGQAY